MKEKNLNISPYNDDYYYAKDGYESAREKNYTQILAVQGRPAQSREFTQVQSMLLDYIKRLGRATIGYSSNPFDYSSDGQSKVTFAVGTEDSYKYLYVNPGYIYVNGLIYQLKSQAKVRISGQSIEKIYAYLKRTIVTETTDESLLNPTTGLPASGYPGAHRLKEEVVFYTYPTVDSDGKPTNSSGWSTVFRCPFCGKELTWTIWKTYSYICPNCEEPYPTADESTDANLVYMLNKGESVLGEIDDDEDEALKYQDPYIATFFKYLIGDCVVEGLDCSAKITQNSSGTYELTITVGAGSCLKDGYLYTSDKSSSFTITLANNIDGKTFLQKGYKSVTSPAKTFHTTLDCYPLVSIDNVGYYDNSTTYDQATSATAIGDQYIAYVENMYKSSSLKIYCTANGDPASTNLIPITTSNGSSQITQYAYKEESKTIYFYPRHWDDEHIAAIKLNDGTFYDFDEDITVMPITTKGVIYVQQYGSKNITSSVVTENTISGKTMKTDLKVAVAANSYIQSTVNYPITFNYTYSLWSTIALYLKAVPTSEIGTDSYKVLDNISDTTANQYSLVLDLEHINDLDKLEALSAPSLDDSDGRIYLGYLRYALNKNTAPIVRKLNSQYFNQQAIQVLANRVDVLTDQVDALIKANADDLDETVMYYLAETFKDLSIVDTSLSITNEFTTGTDVYKTANDKIVGYMDLQNHRFTSTNYLKSDTFGNSRKFDLERNSNNKIINKITPCTWDSRYFFPSSTSQNVYNKVTNFDDYVTYVPSGKLITDPDDVENEIPVEFWHYYDSVWGDSNYIDTCDPNYIDNWSDYASLLINEYGSDGKITASEMAEFYNRLDKLDISNNYSYPGRFNNKFTIPLRTKDGTKFLYRTAYNLVLFDYPSYYADLPDDLKTALKSGVLTTFSLSYKGELCYFYPLSTFLNHYDAKKTDYLDYTYFACRDEDHDYSKYTLEQLVPSDIKTQITEYSTILYDKTQSSKFKPLAFVVAMPLDMPKGNNKFTFSFKNQYIESTRVLTYSAATNCMDILEDVSSTTDLNIQDYSVSDTKYTELFIANTTVSFNFSFPKDYYLDSFYIPNFKGKCVLKYRYKGATQTHSFQLDTTSTTSTTGFKFTKESFVPKNTVCTVNFYPYDSTTQTVNVPVILNRKDTSISNATRIYVDGKAYGYSAAYLNAIIRVKKFATSDSYYYISNANNVAFNKVKFSNTSSISSASFTRTLDIFTNNSSKSIISTTNNVKLNTVYTLSNEEQKYGMRLTYTFTNGNAYNPPKFAYPTCLVSKTTTDAVYISKWWEIVDNPYAVASGYNQANVILYVSVPSSRTYANSLSGHISVFTQCNNETSWGLCGISTDGPILHIANKDNSGLDIYKVIYQRALFNSTTGTKEDITRLRFKIIIDEPNYGSLLKATTILNQISVLIDSKTAVPVTKVTVSPTSLVLAFNASSTLKASLSPSNASNQKITWKSSNTNIATVVDGVVKSKAKAGTATIIATSDNILSDSSDNLTATCKVTVVKELKPTGVEVVPAAKTLYIGNTCTLSATISPDYATNQKVTWSSSNKNVATVTSTTDGGRATVKAIKAGSATITATAAGNANATDTCKITVSSIPVTSITLSKTSLSLYKGNEAYLEATVKPDNATIDTVTWKSSNTKIATVSKAGLVKAVAAGSATITATTDGTNKSGSKLSTTCAVTVTVPTIAISSITLKSSASAIDIGSTASVTATINPSNATNQTLTWNCQKVGIQEHVNNTKIVVKGVSVGNGTVVAMDSNKQIKGSMNIQVYANVTSLVLKAPNIEEAPDTDTYTGTGSFLGDNDPFTIEVNNAKPYDYKLNVKKGSSTNISAVISPTTANQNVIYTVYPTLGNEYGYWFKSKTYTDTTKSAASYGTITNKGVFTALKDTKSTTTFDNGILDDNDFVVVMVTSAGTTSSSKSIVKRIRINISK